MKRIALKYFFYLNIAYLIVFIAPTFLIFRELESLVMEQVKLEENVLFNQVIVLRKWLSEHGVIYVEKKPGVEVNPYLEKIGIKTTLSAEGGKTLIGLSPALVTVKLSQYSHKHNSYWYKIASLKPINTTNKADKTEAEAINSFIKGNRTPIEKVEHIDGVPIYRSIRPMIMENECIKCHKFQGFKVGDVGGALSIYIPFGSTLERLSMYRKLTFSIFILGFLTLNGIMYFISKRVVFTPLHGQVNRDPLTGLYNRRFLENVLENLSFQALRRNSKLGILMCDIDNFKSVNDRYGHDVGDALLKGISNLLLSSVRRSDFVFRIGGEEFLILLIDVKENEAFEIAEKVRKTVEGHELQTPKGILKSSISIGVSEFPTDTKDIRLAIKFADDALLNAKKSGKNIIKRYTA